MVQKINLAVSKSFRILYNNQKETIVKDPTMADFIN
jgi:hypothetical protein